MTGTDEAVLIEIEQRFRRLEDLIEQADAYHAQCQENYLRFTADKARLQELRDRVEAALEACRDDMTSMQERIRR